MSTKESKIIWDRCLDIIRDNVDEDKYQCWFAKIKAIKYESNILTLQLPSQFWYEWLEQHYSRLLQSTLKRVTNPKCELQYAIEIFKNRDETPSSETRNISKNGTNESNSTDSLNKSLTVDVMTDGGNINNYTVLPGVQTYCINPNLNSRYIFDRFIVGNENKVSKTVAESIVNEVGQNSFNPFFIYGATGVGKTHLIQSIGNKLIETRPNDVVVMYIECSQFVRKFTESFQHNKRNVYSAITESYRRCDLLIVDDIQFLCQKTKTQQEFFHVFNSLHQRDKQIVLSSDRSPKDLKDVDDRLISRFRWGFFKELFMPDYETRIKIIDAKARERNVRFSQAVMEYMAYNIKSSVRDIECAITKIIAENYHSPQPIFNNVKQVSKIIQDVISYPQKQVNIEYIQKLVSQKFGVEVNYIKDKSRKQDIVEARHIAMYLARLHTQSSLKSIGLSFGGRDHATVMHAIKMTKVRMRSDKRCKNYIKDLQKEIKLNYNN